MIHVTSHAISRYISRVEPVDHDTARERIVAIVIRTKAALFGAPYIRLPKGQRIVLAGGRVVTVLPADHVAGALDPRRDHLHRREP